MIISYLDPWALNPKPQAGVRARVKHGLAFPGLLALFLRLFPDFGLDLLLHSLLHLKGSLRALLRAFKGTL